MKVSVRVEVNVPTSQVFTERELADKLARVAADALTAAMPLEVEHAASVIRRAR